jgi:NADH-quinone oxidoreductase subunit G
MVKIHIDEREMEVQEGLTILEAAESIGLHIPHLCYHKAFAPEGSCRMCLVEIEGLPKLELACSTRVREGMKVATKSERVVAARKGVLECLLAEHPIDCPICDKAGECKLQDYYEEYGLFESEFKEYKEKRQKKVDIGKNLVLDRERCILCTRCVRFLREVTKAEELGVFQRGIHAEISPYNDVLVDNNYSGNLAEICPVGAITDKDFRFKTRTWFLKSGESICPVCSRGCNIYIESHQGFSRFPLPKKVYRVRSRENQKINGLWICDKGRYGYSYLNEARLDRIIANDFYQVDTWTDLIIRLAEKTKRLYSKMKASRIGVILHSWLTNEELFLIDKLFRKDLGTSKIGFLDPAEEEADGILLTKERTPNRRGAKEIGFDFNTVNWGKFFEGIELLFVFASPVMDRLDTAPIETFSEKIRTKVLLASHLHELGSRFNVVAPVSLIAEKEGSLTNVDGITQGFSPSLDAPENSQPEWKFLVDFARQLRINFKFYNLLSSPESIREEMKKEIPFFEKQSE